MMIGTRELRRSSRATSNPEPSGSITSRSTRSGRSVAAGWSAAAALPATDVSKPSRERASESGAVIDSSSSTSRIRRFFPSCMRHLYPQMPRRPRGEPEGRLDFLGAGCGLARDEASAHAFRCVIADPAPVRVPDALLEPRGQRGPAALAEDAALPPLAATAEPEVVRIVTGVPDDELHDAGLRAGGEADPVAR